MRVQPAGDTALSHTLAGEIRLELQMVALQADNLLQKRQQIVGGGHRSAVKRGRLGGILTGDGPENRKVLHLDVAGQKPPDPTQMPEHAAHKCGGVVGEQVNGGFDALGNMERQTAAPAELILGPCRVNLADAAVYRPGGAILPLTATERALLQKLADNRGHIVTYDALCEAVWGADYYGYENSLNVHIRHLREKIEENASRPQWLLTVRGIGYKLAGEVQA